MYELVRPSKQMEKEIWLYRQEFIDCGEPRINGTCGLNKWENFDEWLAYVTSIVDKEKRKGVHASTFFMIRKSDNKIIGSAQLRHWLSSAYKVHGGHIGYGIRPSMRGKGLGKLQLQLVLEKAKEIDLSEVIITCLKTNLPSKRTAMSCGGVLIDEKVYQGELEEFYRIMI